MPKEYFIEWSPIFAICDTDDKVEEYEGAWVEVELTRLPPRIKARVCGNTVTVSIDEYITLKVRPIDRKGGPGYDGLMRLLKSSSNNPSVCKRRRSTMEDGADSLPNAVKRARHALDPALDATGNRCLSGGKTPGVRTSTLVKIEKAMIFLLEAEMELADASLLGTVGGDKVKLMSCSDLLGQNVASSSISSVSAGANSSWVDVWSESSTDMLFDLDSWISSPSSGSADFIGRVERSILDMEDMLVT